MRKKIWVSYPILGGFGYETQNPKSQTFFGWGANVSISISISFGYLVDFAKVARANYRAQLDVGPIFFPHVFEAHKAGHFEAGLGERATQAVGSARIEHDELVE